jgi:hypothetical protein
MNIDIRNNTIRSDASGASCSSRNLLNTVDAESKNEHAVAINNMTPFAMVRDASLDADLMERASNINQRLRYEYWPKRRKNSAHDGLSLHLTTCPGGKKCKKKACSIQLNSNIIQRTNSK